MNKITTLVTKKIIVYVLAFCMVLSNCTGFTMNVHAKEDTSDRMVWEMPIEHYYDNYCYNIKAWHNGNLIETIDRDGGYKVGLIVDGKKSEVSRNSFFDSLGPNQEKTFEGIGLKINPTLVKNNQYVKVEYILTNTTDKEKTISLGSCGIIKFLKCIKFENATDCGTGFRWEGYNNPFNFVCKDNENVTDVDTVWYGDYMEMYNSIFTQRDVTKYECVHPEMGMAYSWKDRKIGPHETQKYSVLIGIAAENVAPEISVSTPDYGRVYRGDKLTFEGTVSDKENTFGTSVSCRIDSLYDLDQDYYFPSTPGKFKFTVTIPEDACEGEHRIMLGARDAGLKNACVKRKFTILDPPEVPQMGSLIPNQDGSMNVKIDKHIYECPEYYIEYWTDDTEATIKKGCIDWSTDVRYRKIALDKGRVYKFKAKARYAEDCESSWGDVKSQLTYPNTPNAPTVTAKIVEKVLKEMEISWDAVDGEVTKYQVYRNGQAFATVDAPTTTFLDTSEYLNRGISYEYAVVAINNAREYGAHSKISASTTKYVSLNIPSIESITVNRHQCADVKINNNGNPFHTKYYIEYWTDDTEAKIKAGHTEWDKGDRGRTFMTGFLDKEVVYKFKVKAKGYYDNVETPWSDISQLTYSDIPTATMKIKENSQTDHKNITLNLTVEDSRFNSSKMKIMVSQNSDFNDGTWVDFEEVYNYQLQGEDGLKTIYFKVKNPVEKESEVYSKTIILDREAPQIKIEHAKGYTDKDVVLDINISDSTTGINEASITSSSVIRFVTDGISQGKLAGENFDGKNLTGKYTVSGNNTYTITAKDAVGNTATETITINNSDKTVPLLTLTPNTTEWTNKDVLITVTGENDGSSPIDTVTLASGKVISGINKNKYTTTYTVTENGDYIFKLTDKAKNTTSAVITVSNIDKKAPIITGVEDGKTYDKNVDISFNEGIGTLTLNGDTSEKYTPSSDIKISDNGKYLFKVTDEAGNVSSVRFTMDISEIEIGYAPNDSAKKVTKDVILPLVGGDGSTITWKSDNEDIISSDGKVTLPSGDVKSVVVTLTATIKKGDKVEIKTFKLTLYSDLTPPVITLKGDQIVEVEEGSHYVEQGFRAVDDKDGDISDKVLITGYINTNKQGIYILRYTVKDSLLNQTVVTRKIKVIEKIIAKDATLPAEDNEKIDDSKVKEAVQGAKQQGKKDIKIKVDKEVTRNNPVEVSISKEQVENIKGQDIDLIFETENTSIEIPMKAVDTSKMPDNSRLELVCEQVNTEENEEMVEAIKEINSNMGIYKNKIYDFKMKVIKEDSNGNTVGEEEIKNFHSDENIRLRIVVGEVNEQTALMTFYFNPETQKWEYVNGRQYDGEVIINTNHLSIYSVMTLSPEEKREEVTKLINSGNITIKEILTILEDEDMDFDKSTLDKYKDFEDKQKNETADTIKKDITYSDYNDLSDEFTKVVNNIDDRTKKDKVTPVITLNGQDVIKLKVGSTYVEQGAKATDNLEGDITGRIIITQNIDTSKAGDYTITYKVNDYAGNISIVTRKVIVYKPSSNNTGDTSDTNHTNHTNHKNHTKQTSNKNETKEPKEQKQITFKDMQNHWAKTYVEKLASMGILEGDGKGNFNPNMGITRAEIATMLVKMSGKDIELNNLDSGFSDVNTSKWYAPYVAQARKMGVIKGISDTEFQPDRIVNRQEIVAMIMRYYRQTTNTVISEDKVNNNLNYKDAEDIYNYAYNDVYLATLLKIVEGRENNEFVPTSETLRGEAATIIYRLLSVLGKL